MDEQSPSPPANNLIVQSNPQIAAALAVNSPMQQTGPPHEPQQGQFVSPPGPQGHMPAGGPMRIQPMQQKLFPVRAMPYPTKQMRPQHHPIQPQHFGQRPMGMQPQPGPSGHPMGMGQHMGPGQFMQNSSPMPPPPMSHQQSGPLPPQLQQQQQQSMMQSTMPCGAIMDKTKLDDLMQQISTTTVLEDNVKEVLVEYADDFVCALIDKACKMIKNREQKKIESRDIEFLLKNVYNMPVVPRSATHIFGTQHHKEVIDISKEKHIPTEAHKQRVALLKKQLRKA